jgi:hypothetical protein
MSLCSCPLDSYNDTIHSWYLSIGKANKYTIYALYTLYNKCMVYVTMHIWNVFYHAFMEYLYHICMP